MTKQPGKNAIILINGYNFSTFASSYETIQDAGKIPVQGFGDECENYIPGLQSAVINADLFWNSDANSVHTALASMPNGHVTIMPEGYALGKPTQSLPIMQGKYSPKGNPKSAITVGTLNFESYGNNVGLEYGYALAHGSVTSAVTTGIGYQVNAAPVTASCSGTLHVWTPPASETTVFKIQHCTTLGGVYADLITFTINGSSRASERITAASGTINQFIRVLATKSAAVQILGFSIHFWQSVQGA